MKIKDLRKSAEKLLEYLNQKEAEMYLVEQFGIPEAPKKSFHLYASQIASFEKWQQEHKAVCPVRERGAVSGGDKWIFMPTGVGMCIKYICACGDSIDLTEVDKW